MAQEKLPDERLKFSQFPGICTDCGQRIDVNAPIWHNAYKKTARHKNCPQPSHTDAEQRNTFDTWIQAFQNMEGKK
jgi:hypothetical protein